MSIDPVRRLGLDVLVRFEDGGQLDDLLEQARSDLGRLDPELKGAAFLSELVRGSVQWRARYDFILEQFSRKGLPTDHRLLCLLRMSLHQLLALDKVPAYAAVDQAARLCRRRISARTVGYVNGLLQAVRREFLGEGPDEAEPGAVVDRLRAFFEARIDDPVTRLAVWSSHPEWLVKRWERHWGPAGAESICTANNVPTRLCFNVLDSALTHEVADVLAEAGCAVQPGRRSGCLVARDRLGQAVLSDVLQRLPGVIVQDESVQEATDWLLADAVVAGPVLDMCAAPGGKTAVLTQTLPDASPLLAMDNRQSRIDLLRDTVGRIGADEVRLLAGDGQRPPLAPGSCGVVLLDGPCSGTGVLRHHPDGRWRLRPQTPVENGSRLLALAESAADLLAPGGLLLYATCSLEPEENQDVLAALLRNRSDLEPDPRTEITAADDGADTNWQRQWLPGGDAGGDGFFAARLRRRR